VKDRPLIVRRLESLDVVLLGSVHTLYRNVPLILGEIDRLAPGFVGIELTDAGRETGAVDVDAVCRAYRDRLVCLDRPPAVTSSRYVCGTPPWRYLMECLTRYTWLPLNQASITAFNRLHGIYRALLGDRFYTFGWSREDTRRYIFERDEYMAARLVGHMRARRAEGCQDAYAVVVGRRHVAGMAAILEAYALTGDVGSYYAGGRVTCVFSADALDEPYAVSQEVATRRLAANRALEGLVRAIYLPVYGLVLFLFILTAFMLIAITIQALTGR